MDGFLEDMNETLGLEGENRFVSLKEEKKGCNIFHVSLTKLFFLREFQIEPFVRDVRKAVRAPSFLMTLSDPQVFTNEDMSRSFCGVPVQGGLGIVLQLIRQFDEVLTSYHKEVYYDPAIPHGTIGSCVSDLSFLAKKYSVYGNEYKGGEETTDTEVEVSVDSVFLSIGNKTFRIPLDS